MSHPLFAAAAIVPVVILAGCGPREDARTMSPEQRGRALDAIGELHRTDQAASLAGDTETLISLWSDDPVALPPGGPIRRGRDSLEASLRRMAGAGAAWETLEYVQEFGEVEVLGDYAWDWGTYRGRSRNRETGREVASSGKLLRILKRTPDGTWTVHRSIWNVAPAAPEEGPS